MVNDRCRLLSQLLISEGSQLRRFLGVWVEESSDRVKGESDNVTDCRLNVPGDFFCNRHWDCPYVRCCDFSEAYIKLSHFSLHSCWKRAILILMIASQKGGKKIENVSLESQPVVVRDEHNSGPSPIYR